MWLAGSNVDLARDGLVDDGLLLLLQQLDQLFLGADVAPDAPVGVVEETDYSTLFRARRHQERDFAHSRCGQIPLPYPDTVGSSEKVWYPALFTSGLEAR